MTDIRSTLIGSFTWELWSRTNGPRWTSRNQIYYLCYMLGQNEPPHLVGDQVLADGQGHLDGVGLVRDGDGVHLELVFAVQSVGLAHRLLKHLLVALLAQHGPDVHQPRFTTAASHRAALQHGEEEHATQLHWEEEKQSEVREQEENPTAQRMSNVRDQRGEPG